MNFNHANRRNGTDMKKIKIVHMITSLEQGGAQAVLYQLLQSLDQEVFDHHVIYFYGGPYVEKIEKLGVSLYHVQGTFFPFDPVGIYRCGTYIKQIAPDVLHTLLWGANFVGRWYAGRYGIAHVQVMHNNIDQNGFIRNFLDRISRRIRHGAVTSIAVSDGVARSIASYAPWFAQEPVEVITNGIDALAIDSKISVARASLGLLDSDFVIGTVGRFEWVKNYSLLLTVFALIYDQHTRAYLIMIGTGSQESYLKKRAYDLGIDDRVIFIIDQEAAPYYGIFDCFVMTSYKEGISLALLEAMARGVVPIVMAVNDKHDVVEDHKNGLLAYSDNPEEFVQAINTLMQRQDLKNTLSNGAKCTAATKFRVDTMIKKYGDLYTKMAAPRG